MQIGDLSPNYAIRESAARAGVVNRAASVKIREPNFCVRSWFNRVRF